jgi:hypothetical protein
MRMHWQTWKWQVMMMGKLQAMKFFWN